jgi:hypothetical protein
VVLGGRGGGGGPPPPPPPPTARNAARSFRFARRIAAVMTGDPTFANPEGSPRLRSVIRVPPPAASTNPYVVSIGNGPSAVRMTSRSPGTSSTIS